MTKHISKASLVKDATSQHRRLEKTLASLTPQQMETPGVTGEWSVKDLLFHLAAWEKNLVAWYAAGRRGERPDMACVASRQGMNDFNQQVYEQNHTRPLAEARAEFTLSYQQILRVVDAIPEDEMFTHNRFAWTGKWLLADFVSANLGNHYKWAKDQIKKWRQK